MCQVVRTLAGLDYDIIHVHFNLLMAHVVKNGRHTSYVGVKHIFEAERHHPVVIYTPMCNENRFSACSSSIKI